MSRSWNHRIVKECRSYSMTTHEFETISADEQIKRVLVLGYTCSAPKCTEDPKHICAYDYITGRQGRTSYAERFYCQKHTEAFAEKHGLTI